MLHAPNGRAHCKAQVRHALQPLCDLSATKIQNDRRGRRGVATRFCSWSPTRRRLIGDWLPTDRRPCGDLFATWCNWSPTGRGPVPDSSPTSRRSVADQVNLKLLLKRKTLIISFNTDELNKVHILSFINYMYWNINRCTDYTIRSEEICRSLQPWCMNWINQGISKREQEITY